MFAFKGHRVQIPAYYDLWMMGDRFGEIVGYVKSRKQYRVKMDKTGKTIRLSEDEINLV